MENRIWTFFFVMLAAVALWFTGSSLYDLYGYMRLNASSPSTSITWNICKLSKDRYALKGLYTFSFQDKSYTNESLVTYPAYRNPFSAEAAIKEQNKRPIVWFSSSNPARSALHKYFPIKESVSAVLLWSILFYFFCLKNYVSKVDHGNRSAA